MAKGRDDYQAQRLATGAYRGRFDGMVIAAKRAVEAVIDDMRSERGLRKAALMSIAELLDGAIVAIEEEEAAERARAGI
jgi:hypothetical protein